MLFRNTLPALVFLLISLTAFPQSKVNLLSGKIVEGKVVSTEDERVHVKVTTKKGKKFDTYIENYRIFSIIDSSGKEMVIYKQDSSIGNYLQEPEMKYYMVGEQDAYKNYKPIGTMIVGTSLGIGFGLLDTYSFGDPSDPTIEKGFFKSSPGFLTLIYPFGYTIFAGMVPRPQLDIRNVTDRNNLNSEHYIQGFARVARFKRLVRALISSCAGSAIGLGTYYLFK